MKMHRDLVGMIVGALIVLLSMASAVAQTSQTPQQAAITNNSVKGPGDGAPAAREADRAQINQLRQAREEAMQRLKAARAAGDKAAARSAQNDLRQIEQRVHALRKASQQPHNNGRPSDHPRGQDVGEIRGDRQEIREDRAEIRQDRGELREDMGDLRDARKAGDKEAAAAAKGEIRDDRAELRGDRRDLRDDKHELRQDVRDVHQSGADNPSPRRSERNRHQRHERRP
jgi:hypothetical protein